MNRGLSTRLCCGVVLLVLTQGSFAFGQARPSVRVFTFTAPPTDGNMTPDLQARTDSLRDVNKRLFGSYKNIPIVLSATRNDADVIVEITGRETDPKDDDVRIVHARLTCGDIAITIDGTDDDGEWGAAAGDAANQIRKWIWVNHDQMLLRRESKGSPSSNAPLHH